MGSSGITLKQWCENNGNMHILDEWSCDNFEITPENVTYGSKKKAIWKCNKCKENYEMPIQGRTLKNSSCPKCGILKSHEKSFKNLVLKNGSIMETDNELLKKWDFSRNTISPRDVTRRCNKEVYWICPTCGNSFKSKVRDVKKNDTCRKCKGNKYIDLGKDGKFYIYKHTVPNGKIYIGCSSMPVKKRFGNGNCYKGNIEFDNAIKEYGWENIEHEILLYDLEEEDAFNKEKMMIKKFDSSNPNIGYNISTGGKGSAILGRSMSEETKNKISLANKGKIRTEENIKKLKESHKGKKSHHVRAVRKLTLDGLLIKEYDSTMDAVRDNEKVDQNSIWRCCNGKAKTAGGYKWEYSK